MRQMKHIKPLISLLTALALLLTLFFVIEEQDHVCCGEECDVCAVVAICPGSDNNDILLFAPVIPQGLSVSGCEESERSLSVADVHLISPVTQKVRLNN